MKSKNYILLLFLFICNTALAQFPSMQVKLPHCDYPKDAKIADINGDGYNDIIVASQNDNKISWLQNEGNQTFKWQHIIKDDFPMASIIQTADIDLDGDIDVIGASIEYNYDQEIPTLMWYENDGNGIFSSHNIDNLGILYDTAIGDLDGDGDTDVLATDRFTKALVWYKNDGTGNFAEAEIIQEGMGSIDKVLSEDLDGDGDMDILISSSARLAMFTNDGSASFGSLTYLESNGAALDKTIADIQIVDIDKDGDKDIVNTNHNNINVFLRRNDGMGNFSVPETIITHSSSYNDLKIVNAMDINEDGILDILTSTLQNQVIWFEQTETGVFLPAKSLPTLQTVSGIVVGDLNGDDLKDLLTLSLYNGAVEWLQIKAAEVLSYSLVAASWQKSGNIRFGDINNDNHLDIVTASGPYNAHLILYESNTKGDFSLPIFIDSQIASFNDYYLVDWDNDENLDIVASVNNDDNSQELVWYQNQGNSTFTKIPLTEIGIFWRFWKLGDIDSDGLLDLVLLEKISQNLVWYKNNGNSTFAPPQIVAENIPTIKEFVTIADLDGDKTNDLLIHFNYALAYYANDGNGGFANAKTVYEENGQSSSMKFYYEADLDGDNLWDIVSRDYDIINLHKNLGNGIYEEKQVVFEADIDAVSFNDINQDGLLDILVTTKLNIALYDYDIVWYKNQGDKTFIGPNIIGHVDMSTSIDEEIDHFFYDLDSDGDMDIIWAVHYIDERLIVFENATFGNSIKGMVYLDNNENGLLDEEEFGLPNQVVQLDPVSISTSTNTGGHFYFDVPTGEYQLSYPSHPIWQLTNPQPTYDITITENENETLPVYLFGLKPHRSFSKANIDINNAPIRCNSLSTYWLTYSNTGTTIANGTVTLEVDELMDYAFSNPSPDLIEGKRLTWNFTDLLPSHANQIFLQFQMPNEEFIGETLETQATVEFFNDNQELIYSKSTNYDSEVLCSYDPNDKLTRSNLLGQSEFAYLADTLYYTVRFQNTGNDTAFNIRIEDTLDKKLDWTTFHPITASHEYRTELNRETGLVTFYFNDIMLPDSTTNEPESHGFVMFGIASLPDLQDKIEVDNTASIFFDFNPPIITNTATLTLIEQVETNIEVLENGASIRVFPNPFSDYTTIEVNGLSAKGDYRLELMDILGRKVRELNLKNGEVRLDRGDLESGLYLIQVLEEESSEILASGKVLVD